MACLRPLVMLNARSQAVIDGIIYMFVVVFRIPVLFFLWGINCVLCFCIELVSIPIL